MTTSSHLMRSAAIAIAIAAVAGVAFWTHDSFAAQEPFAFPGTSGTPHSAEHMTRLSENINAQAGTTPQQKAQIDALLAQASRDFEPMHARMQEDHPLAIALLTQDRIDRAELESLRQDHLRLADQASQRMTQLAADVAEVLTPAQRKALAAHAQQHPGGHMGRHHGG